MKDVFQNWNSFCKSLKDYRKHPHKYQARPRIPSYKQGTEKEVIISNQEAKTQGGRFLKLPKMKTRLTIGNLGASARREGKAEGKAEGEAEEKAKIAMNLIRKGMAFPLITEVTGMSIEEIESLKENDKF